MRTKIVGSLLALAVGLAFSLAVAAILGESPVRVATILLQSSFTSLTDFGYSLYYATPLIFVGLSVAWAFRAGLFNIGADGQMVWGGLACASVGICFPQAPGWVAVPLALCCAFIAGGLWGALAGWIKAYRGCHEVLATIMLNFIAYGVTTYFILYVFKNPLSQVPETAEIGPSYWLEPLRVIGGASPLSTAFLISLVFLFTYSFAMSKTKLGLYQRMAGGAMQVGRLAGINMDRQVVLAMFISGGLAGLAAAAPVLGFAHKTREGFTSGAGFVGIAVALLGGNSALGILAASLLFGLLTKGALDLDLDTKYVSKDLALVIQALIILTVASQNGIWRWLRRERT